jgi:hypothetical protein
MAGIAQSLGEVPVTLPKPLSCLGPGIKKGARTRGYGEGRVRCMAPEQKRHWLPWLTT